jgi:hypothetical protein
LFLDLLAKWQSVIIYFHEEKPGAHPWAGPGRIIFNRLYDFPFRSQGNFRNNPAFNVKDGQSHSASS